MIFRIVDDLILYVRIESDYFPNFMGNLKRPQFTLNQQQQKNKSQTFGQCTHYVNIYLSYNRPGTRLAFLVPSIHVNAPLSIHTFIRARIMRLQISLEYDN